MLVYTCRQVRMTQAQVLEGVQILTTCEGNSQLSRTAKQAAKPSTLPCN